MRLSYFYGIINSYLNEKLKSKILLIPGVDGNILLYFPSPPTVKFQKKNYNKHSFSKLIKQRIFFIVFVLKSHWIHFFPSDDENYFNFSNIIFHFPVIQKCSRKKYNIIHIYMICIYTKTHFPSRIIITLMEEYKKNCILCLFSFSENFVHKFSNIKSLIIWNALIYARGKFMIHNNFVYTAKDCCLEGR